MLSKFGTEGRSNKVFWIFQIFGFYSQTWGSSFLRIGLKFGLHLDSHIWRSRILGFYLCIFDYLVVALENIMWFIKPTIH